MGHKPILSGGWQQAEHEGDATTETRAATTALIDVNETARRLGVTTRFVRRLVDERRIPFHKIGKYVRFDQTDVNDFAAKSRVEAMRP